MEGSVISVVGVIDDFRTGGNLLLDGPMDGAAGNFDGGQKKSRREDRGLGQVICSP